MARWKVIWLHISRAKIRNDLLNRRHLKMSCCLSSVTYSTETIVTSIPSPKKIPIIGTWLSLLAAGGPEKLHEYIHNRHRELGPIFKEQLGPITSVFISDARLMREVFAKEGKFPKHILPESWILYNKLKDFKRGLYFMDGEEWLTHRKILNRILLKENIAIKDKNFDRFLENYLQKWIIESRDGFIQNLEKRLYDLSLIFMVSFLVGNSFVSNADTLLPHIHRLATVVGEIFRTSVKLSTIPANIAKTFGLNSWKRFEKAVDESVSLSSVLLNAMFHCVNDGVLHDLMLEKIPSPMLKNILIDFIIAAGDTTATATQWILYCLGRDETLQERLFIELQNVDRIEDAQLLKNILKESMRLYPVAPFISRYLPEETTISSYKIAAGELITTSMYTSGRDEKYFPRANIFDPDRWHRLPESGKFKGVIDSYATLPYASGSRSCIGRKMAHFQLLTTIAKIVTMYELNVPNSVGIKLNLITVPSEEIRLQVRKR